MDLDLLLKELNLLPDKECPTGLAVEAVSDSSRDCGPETLFVAIAGTKVDGHSFLADAAGRGCRVALVSRKDLRAPKGMTLVPVANTRRALALIAQRLAGDPSRELLVLGVTGTKGKTTVTYLLESILRAAGLKTGVLGTVNYRWNEHIEVASAPQTTPSPMELARYLAAMKRDGVQAVAMEVSSHAIDQYRIDGISFKAAGLTNLTRDHLDYHETVEQYCQAKERLFTEVLSPQAVAVLNLDDSAGRRFALSTCAAQILGLSLHRFEARLRVKAIQFFRAGMRIDAIYDGHSLRLETPMHGLFNVQNCLVAAGLALAAGLPEEAIRKGLAATQGAPGRFEFINAGQQFPIIIDYAHTPDSLTQLLLNARGLTRRRLIVVFGCGGDRDAGKRPLMGNAAARVADVAIVTNDNPRTEEPQAIAQAIVEGIEAGRGPDLRWHVQLDRREAIKEAIEMASAEDTIVIAGKGHENYQILGATKIHFDDKEEAIAALVRAGAAPGAK